ncbi:acyltransferase family protein [Arthrobacter sp. I2-34]|uniref:Acyltransferase family protein n=1 Tax=Arthrobacter hankyongi TaxID=2904801 RepID=A0ABS9L6H6_9MICC|nr:acyltransferase family protein [Arthrobacter hankyongi]MCG2622285.1 acyltransferase family protein [Arthrobacter hankyongi]
MSTAPRARSHRLDAAKGVLIVLVVLGHVLEAVASWAIPTTRLPLTAIYLFHMPAFVFLAGVTAKATHLLRRLGTFAVILLAAQALYLIAVQLLGANRSFSLLVPFWILWFLLAMIWWLLLLPLVQRFPKASVAVSVLLAAVAGTVEWVDYTLSLSRTLVFLPFFVVGAAYGKRILAAVPRLPTSAKLGAVALGVAAWLLLYELQIKQAWLYGSKPFYRLDIDDPEGIVVRAGLLCIAAVAALGFLSLVPDRPGVLAALGRRSLAVFLLHGFVVLGLQPYLRTLPEEIGSLPTLAVCLLLTLAIVAVFSIPLFDAAIRRFSQGTVELLCRPFARRQALETAAGDGGRAQL